MSTVDAELVPIPNSPIRDSPNPHGANTPGARPGRVITVAAALDYDPAEFDPLVELYGLWTPELADRYLPIPGMPPAKYECLDGKLIVSPYEGFRERLRGR